MMQEEQRDQRGEFLSATFGDYLSATDNPDGKNGGPLLETLVADRQNHFYSFSWPTMPEQLEARNISWKVYSPPDSTLENNVLLFFKQYQNPLSSLAQKAFVPSFPGTFQLDVASGNLPQVSWVLGGQVDSEHPPAPSAFGENDLASIISAVTANPTLWQKTVIFATYDENGGFFDHVVPPTPPPNTPGEFVTATPVNGAGVLGSPPITGPIGLGFRVPMMVISPFSQGGFVSSDLFDHTSVLRFLETRLGAEVPNLSAWRRAIVGDLTSAFNFAAPNYTAPALPSTVVPSMSILTQCVLSLAGTLPYTLPTTQGRPGQETGSAPAPSGPVVPTLSSMNPTSAGIEGGTRIVINGTALKPGVTVSLGGQPVTNITVNPAATTLTGNLPAHPAGQVDVTITNPGYPAVTYTNAFTYGPVAPIVMPARTSDGTGGSDTPLPVPSNTRASSSGSAPGPVNPVPPSRP